MATHQGSGTPLELRENNVIGHIEAALLNQNRNIHIALEEKNFVWGRNDVLEFEVMYKAGKSLNEIAEYFEKETVEVLLLALDRIEKGKIKIREGWRIV